VAYRAWERVYTKDAILISDRLVYDVCVFLLYSLRSTEIEARQTKLGRRRLRGRFPRRARSRRHLDGNGDIRIGDWVEGRGILVGKVTPRGI
jgi:DNA-directed RNA polymerase beta subunit